MENPADQQEENYEEAKFRAAKLYQEIKYVWCPAVGDNVVFDRSGFNHLIRKRGEMRPQSEQKRRFDLLLHARDILSDPTVDFSHETKKVKNVEAHLWVFKAIHNGIAIKIIVRQGGKGKKHFLSIYGKKQKHHP